MNTSEQIACIRKLAGVSSAVFDKESGVITVRTKTVRAHGRVFGRYEATLDTKTGNVRVLRVGGPLEYNLRSVIFAGLPDVIISVHHPHAWSTPMSGDKICAWVGLAGIPDEMPIDCVLKKSVLEGLYLQATSMLLQLILSPRSVSVICNLNIVNLFPTEEEYARQQTNEPA